MIVLPFEMCSGCAACMNGCPVQAISMQEDDYGYIHAHIDTKKCIKCHLCEKICPVYVDTEKKDPIKIYAAKTKKHEIHETSASGGIGYFLCRNILGKGGIIYGCYQESYSQIKHIRIDHKEDLYKIQNSKYVQSDIGYVMMRVKEDLLKGKKVVFTGCPCHIAGLRNYLKKPYENLLTVDLVCHGVPPMKMLKEQVEGEKFYKKYSKEIFKVDFRWKTKINNITKVNFGLRYFVEIGNSKKIIKIENDIINPYMRGFQTGITLRDSCLHCLYTTKDRVSDLTIADFWGLGTQIQSKMNASTGVSLVIINSLKGIEAFEEVKNCFEIEEHEFEEAALCNRCLSKPFPILPQRDIFLKLYKTKGLTYAIKRTDSFHKFERNYIIRNFRKYRYLNYSLNISLRIFRKLKKIFV